MGNEFGHPEWIDFPRDDTRDSSTNAFIPGMLWSCLVQIALVLLWLGYVLFMIIHCFLT